MQVQYTRVPIPVSKIVILSGLSKQLYQRQTIFIPPYKYNLFHPFWNKCGNLKKKWMYLHIKIVIYTSISKKTYDNYFGTDVVHAKVHTFKFVIKYNNFGHIDEKF
jgi:hypothetical protein